MEKRTIRAFLSSQEKHIAWQENGAQFSAEPIQWMDECQKVEETNVLGKENERE